MGTTYQDLPTSTAEEDPPRALIPAEAMPVPKSDSEGRTTREGESEAEEEEGNMSEGLVPAPAQQRGFNSLHLKDLKELNSVGQTYGVNFPYKLKVLDALPGGRHTLPCEWL